MYRQLFGTSALLLALAACAGGDDEADIVIEDEPINEPSPEATTSGANIQTANAVFANDQGTEIGTATLTQEGTGVRIVVDLAFLQGGERGFHIHDIGSCEAPSFDSAGEHFNPTAASHGSEHPQGPHAGDLANLVVDTDEGTAHAEVTNELVSLAPDQPNSLLDADGAALVVHAEPDDYVTQPSGDSGARVACAVIVPA